MWRWVLVLSAAATAASPRTCAADWTEGFEGPGAVTSFVYDLEYYDGTLFAGGRFYSTEDDTTLYCLGRWDGQRWQPVGGGVDYPEECGNRCTPYVQALGIFEDKLILGGNFRRAPALTPQYITANFIASWDGAHWATFGSGLNGPALTVLTFGDDLYVGGLFRTAGGVSAANIARWDGVQWHALGSGTDGTVTELCVYQGELYVGGLFTQAGGIACPGLAIWTGTTWRSVAPPVTLRGVYPLQVFQGKLIAHGEFGNAYSPDRYYFASWDGAAWSRLPSPPGNAAAWADLAVFQGRLWAVGANTSVFDGASWTAVEPGFNAYARCLLVRSSSLFVGGYFTQVGEQPARFVARWDDATPVVIADLHARSDIATGAVRIEWELDRSASSSGIFVRVERSWQADGAFAAISPLLGAEQTGFTDPERGYRSAWYRLEIVPAAGNATYTYAVPVESARAAPFLAVAPQASGMIHVRYFAGSPDVSYRLDVYDVAGRFVRSLASGRSVPEAQSKMWSPSLANGTPIARGVYFVTLRAGASHLSRPVLVTRRP